MKINSRNLIEAWAYVCDGDLYSNGVGELDIYGSKKQAKINSTKNQRERAELTRVEVKF